MIYDFKYRKLTSKEKTDIKANCLLLDQILKRCPGECGNPECRYPLPSMDNFRIPDFGEVCELCYQLYHAVSERMHFVKLHREWKEKNNGKERY